MAVDYFLKIDGIPGESTDASHGGEIDVMSWSQGVSQTGSMNFGGGGGAGKANFNDFSFTMKVSKASPKLFDACCTGDHIASAVLTCRKAGKTQQEYMKIEFTDVLISSYQSGASSEEPIDSISFNFAKIKFSYKPQKKDGTLDAAIEKTYDVKANQAS